MIRHFRRLGRDESGNFVMILALAWMPVFFAIMTALEYGTMTLERNKLTESLDAAAFAAGREFINGKTTAEIEDYAEDFFFANLQVRDKTKVDFTLDFPETSIGGGQMKVGAEYDYQPMFARFYDRISSEKNPFKMSAETTIKLKNTSEIALVVDNSGSMAYVGPGGSGKTRLSIIKQQFTKLVNEVSNQGGKIKQLEEPVRFSVVPFAASVNVKHDSTIGATTEWIDGFGKSSISHENFDWSTLTQVYKSGSKWYFNNGSTAIELSNNFDWAKLKTAYKSGRSWFLNDGTPLSRFTLLQNIRERELYKACSSCSANTVYDGPARWKGCVESRPYPLNINDTPATQGNWQSLFVPMFGPDEKDSSSSSNSYISDRMTDSDSERQRNVVKYFGATYSGTATWTAPVNILGPNYSCTTPAILPITETTSTTGRNKVLAKVNELVANGATNITEGMAWGWRTLSTAEPFTGARPETERGNDKYLIVLTDGENTYYTPSSLGFNDNNSNRSIYGAYGYTGVKFDGGSRSRLFMDTTNTATNDSHSNSNFGKAMNFHMRKLCDNVKAEVANVADPADPFPGVRILMIALDLDADQQANMLPDMQYCASPVPDGMSLTSGNTKMLWNITSGEADEAVDEIIRLLSNMRLTS